MALDIRTLKKQPIILDIWDDTIWTVMMKKPVVHRHGEIAFLFKNSTGIRVGE